VEREASRGGITDRKRRNKSSISEKKKRNVAMEKGTWNIFR
jgi:hypothetical protein